MLTTIEIADCMPPCSCCTGASATMYTITLGGVKLILCVICLSNLCNACERHTRSFEWY